MVLCEGSVASQVSVVISGQRSTIATVQAPAMSQRAIATVQASAMCHCQKLSTAGVHISGVPHASFLL